MDLAIIGVAALAVLNGAYLFTAWRKGTNQATSDAAAAWKDEAEALQVRVGRLEDELKTERLEKAAMSGRITELSNQNANLAGLVVGETVPKPLADALTASTERVVTRVAESEDRIATGILHMTNAVTKVVGELRDALVEFNRGVTPRGQ